MEFFNLVRSLHNQEVAISRGADLLPLPARVIGFSYDPETDSQPLVLVRYDDGETDDVRLSRVISASPGAIRVLKQMSA